MTARAVLAAAAIGSMAMAPVLHARAEPRVGRASAGVTGPAAEGPGTGRASDVEVGTSLDRDAAWVADRFVYTVRLTCLHGTDVLIDDLGADKLHLDGPQIVGFESTREDRGNGVIAYRVAYHLTTYRIDPAVQQIGDWSVRYYVRRPGQRIDDAAPAGQVPIPGRRVVVRSLLPDDRETALFRDARPPVPRPVRYSMLQPIGVGLLALSLGPAAVWAVAAVRRRPSRQSPRPARQARRDQRASLESLRAIDPGDENQRRSAYDLIIALVRQHLRESWSIQADALTAVEAGARLSELGPAGAGDLATSVLAACERARYGGLDGLGSAEDCRVAIDRTAELLGSR